MSSKNPVITAISEDGRVATIKFIDGRKYKLQHPGNRIHLDWQREYISLSGGIDSALFLEKALEHCVIPDGHSFKPSVDNIHPREVGAWQRLLRRFLDGDLGDVPEGGADKTEAASRGKGQG